jgi:uncharacterized membrane protein
MKWKKPVIGVPLHPLLVHFPIAFWIAVPALDVGALLTGRETWRTQRGYFNPLRRPMGCHFMQ